MKTRRVYGLSILASAFLLAACGGGDENVVIGGSGGPGSPVTLQGLWSGDILGSSDTILLSTEIRAAVVFNNRLLMADDTRVVYDGAYDPSGSTQFQANEVRRYNPGSGPSPGLLRIVGVLQSDNISGQLLVLTVTEVNQIPAPQSVHLQPNSAFQQPAGMQGIAFNWQEDVPVPAVALTADDSGGIFLTQGACNYSGTVTIPDTNRNLYAVSLGSGAPGGGCAGAVTGYAALYDNGTRLRLIAAGNNGALYLDLVRS